MERITAWKNSPNLMVPLMVPYFSLGQQMDVFFAQGT
jgi:hypothetical protein